jgi:hypothetical protein
VQRQAERQRKKDQPGWHGSERAEGIDEAIVVYSHTGDASEHGKELSGHRLYGRFLVDLWLTRSHVELEEVFYCGQVGGEVIPFLKRSSRASSSSRKGRPSAVASS